MTPMDLDAALRQVHALVDTLEDEPAHVRQVCRLALELFDQTVSLHGGGGAARALLEAAALLHDTGYRLGAQGHHKRSRDIILGLEIPGFSEEARRMVACIARYHRKSHPNAAHRVFRELAPEAQGLVTALAAILRIADGLDRAHGGCVQGLRVQLEEKKVIVRAPGASPVDLYGARRKSGLFEEVFGVEVHLEAT